MMTRFLVIGTNFISDRFAEAVERTDCAEISAVLSRKEESASAFIKKHNLSARGFCDAEAAAKSRAFDAVYVASPNLLHVSQTKFFLAAGYDVLCEKPASFELAGFLDARECAKANGRLYLEAMRQSHDPATETIRERLSEIGTVRSARFEFSQYSSRYDRFLAGEAVNTFDPSMKNAALLDLGVYCVHLAVTLFGEPKEALGRSVFLENGFEAAGAAIMTYPGFSAEIAYSKVAQGATPSVILGERGAITIDRISEPRDVRIRLGKGEFEKIPVGAPENNMIYEIRDFCAMRGDHEAAERFILRTEKTLSVIDKIKRTSGIKFD